MLRVLEWTYIRWNDNLCWCSCYLWDNWEGLVLLVNKNSLLSLKLSTHWTIWTDLHYQVIVKSHEKHMLKSNNWKNLFCLTAPSMRGSFNLLSAYQCVSFQCVSYQCVKFVLCLHCSGILYICICISSMETSNVTFQKLMSPRDILCKQC